MGARTLAFGSATRTQSFQHRHDHCFYAPTQMSINQGDGQTATAGSAIATAPRVLIRDVSNNPVSGVAVTFAVASGGGSVLPACGSHDERQRPRGRNVVDTRLGRFC
ncbi:MAG: hypothetical protein R2910_10415 [Gemmatimonadales bacterium]